MERRPTRVFLLSPARLDGTRAATLLRPDARSPLAASLRSREGVEIGEVFRFLSSLYFRGKLAYARTFATPPEASWVGSGALVITANRGLIPAETRVCVEHLEAFRETDIHQDEAAFRGPLERDAALLADALGDAGEAVLLGSVATAKYTAPLTARLGARLLFPRDFVGRGDMSRGGLLLRASASRIELAYVPVAGTGHHGARPPRLGRSPRPPRGAP